MKLPSWLDQAIYQSLNGKYCRSNSDMVVIDWNKNDVLNYLGTYCPRSYVEAYSIFTSYFQQFPHTWEGKEKLKIFDFGCGTGGQLLGFLDALAQTHPNLRELEIKALDGNHEALRLFQKLLDYRRDSKCAPTQNIHLIPIPIRIDDFYDMGVMMGVVQDKYDLIITFKAICEFVTKDRFEHKNAYQVFCQNFMPLLSSGGIMTIADVTTYNNTSQEWLPLMLDNGIKDYEILYRNHGYNQLFQVTHSLNRLDNSKIAYRILSNKKQ